MTDKFDLKNIDIKFRKFFAHSDNKKSISLIGLDTEAYEDGKCFLICTSLGDTFDIDLFPSQLFSSSYRSQHIVCYNLKYDMGHLISFLPVENLTELWKKGKTTYQKYEVNVIPKKYLKIKKGKYMVHIWDIFSFFNTSLDNASKYFLNDAKIDLGVKEFSYDYVLLNYREIEKYCIKDAQLVQRLGTALIKHFENFDVYPKRLFSTAYISASYFSSKCSIPSIKRFYDNDRDLIQYALRCYHGGKFEVTEKGIDNYFEYDINSAYPFQIGNLLDISTAKTIHSSEYQPKSSYGFLHVEVDIQTEFFHPLTVKVGELCIYPIGKFTTYCTKSEFDYFVENHIPIKILDGYWLQMRSFRYPFRNVITKLYAYKSECKKQNKIIDYHIIKLLLNSFYGKFIQLIQQDERWKAGAYFNPIYASVITANTRTRVSGMQQTFPSIVACFTDSVISTKPLDLKLSDDIGEWNSSSEGKGVILGSGIYEIGSKCKFRGFHTHLSIWELLEKDIKKVSIDIRKCNTWIEVIFHGWDLDRINRFEDVHKEIEVNFDQKRIWLNDWKLFSDVLTSKVFSLPHSYSDKVGML